MRFVELLAFVFHSFKTGLVTLIFRRFVVGFKSGFGDAIELAFKPPKYAAGNAAQHGVCGVLLNTRVKEAKVVVLGAKPAPPTFLLL